MPVVSADVLERAEELEEKYADLRTSVRVATDDLRQLAAQLHTMDAEETYDAIVDIAKALERDAGIYRKEAE
ncbi:hypothetical protein ACQKK5_08040 [Brevibacillus panacihumi]|uniref:hypothetical protein n=1 Tax=Brevibacillus panacihumi TaxID=497735 RepID=UPI003CFBC79C